MSTLVINGEERQTEATNVANLLASIDVHPRTVVVELNGEIIPRSSFDRFELKDGDKLEIVQMMAGG